MTEVINIYHQKPYDVYVGREGKGEDGYYGNPYDKDDRDTNVRNFRSYFEERIKLDAEFRERVNSLKGKKLGCFCSPQNCHAMVYVEYLEGKSISQQMMEYTASMGKQVMPNIFDDL
jgi:hypothetical protein